MPSPATPTISLRLRQSSQILWRHRHRFLVSAKRSLTPFEN